MGHLLQVTHWRSTSYNPTSKDLNCLFKRKSTFPYRHCVIRRGKKALLYIKGSHSSRRPYLTLQFLGMFSKKPRSPQHTANHLGNNPDLNRLSASHCRLTRCECTLLRPVDLRCSREFFTSTLYQCTHVRSPLVLVGSRICRTHSAAPPVLL